jgi:hypothetical protein
VESAEIVQIFNVNATVINGRHFYSAVKLILQCAEQPVRCGLANIMDAKRTIAKMSMDRKFVSLTEIFNDFKNLAFKSHLIHPLR